VETVSAGAATAAKVNFDLRVAAGRSDRAAQKVLDLHPEPPEP